MIRFDCSIDHALEMFAAVTSQELHEELITSLSHLVRYHRHPGHP